jgi:hypothetical protein
MACNNFRDRLLYRALPNLYSPEICRDDQMVFVTLKNLTYRKFSQEYIQDIPNQERKFKQLIYKRRFIRDLPMLWSRSTYKIY